MDMNRVAIYGKATPEKEQLVSKLIPSTQFHFLTSTAENRFSFTENGLSVPLHTASRQLLLVNLDNDKFKSLPSLKDIFYSCDFHLPLVIIFHGENNPMVKVALKGYQKNFKDSDNIKVLYAEKIEKITLDKICTLLTELKINPDYKPSSSMTSSPG